MGHWTHLSSGIFRWILQTTWQAAVLAVLILLAQWLLRKRLPPSWRYGLWLLLILRLLMPASPQSAFSIFNLTRTAPKIQIAAAPPAAPVVNRHEPAVALPPIAPAISQPQETPRPVQAPIATAPVKAAAKPRSATKLDWFSFAICGWLVGVSFFAARLLWTNWRFCSRIATYQPITDENVMRLFNECRATFKITRSIRLIETEEVESPAVYGLWRKWLLLPDGAFERFSMQELRCIFLHELAHIRRGDLLVNWLVAVLQMLHWFNPILWLAWARMRADRELATDALALTHVRETDRAPYGETILKVLEGLSGGQPLPGLVGIVENKAQLKERLAAIGRPGRHWKWAALVVTVLIAGLGLTSAQNKTSTPKKPENHQPPTHPVVTNGPAMKVTVLDAETGKPVPDAEVLAPNQAAFWGGTGNAPHWTTDTSGVALIHLGVPPPNHLHLMTWFTMSVRHDGYAPRGVSWSAENKDVRPSMPSEVTVRLEHGLTAGGIVHDEAGAPIAGIRVHVRGTSYWGGLRHEYSEFSTGSLDSSSVITDAQGRWQVKDFPRDLEYITLTLSWSDGPGEQFTIAPDTHGANPFIHQNPGQPFSLEDFRAGKAVFAIRKGTAVRGVVVDPAGHSLAGVPVKASFGLNHRERLKETRTDAAGKFEFPHFLHRQLLVTVCPENFAVTSMVIDVNTDATESRIQVDPRRPLRILVEDGNGRPLAGAKIEADNYRSEGHLLDFSAKTGPDGIAVWTNAPISDFALTAVSADHGAHQKIRLTSTQREVTFKLRSGMDKEVIVTARAHDAATGNPVALDSLGFQTADQEGFSTESEKAGSAIRLTVPSARFRTGGFYPQYQVQARAKGYTTFISPWRDFDEGDWSPDFTLEPANQTTRIVLLPDGSPAADARVWSHFEQGRSGIFMSRPDQLYGDRLTQTRTGTDGSFEVPSISEDEPIIFTHAKGFLQTTVAEIKSHPNVQLQPYGRVEGVLKIAGQPRQGVSVNISMLHWSPTRHFDLIYTARTDDDGSFTFTNVPAGDYKLYRTITHPVANGRPITEDHQMPITIKAGERLSVQYSNGGRQVIGQAVPENPDIEVNWLYDDHTLILKQPPLQQSVDFSDYATSKDFEAARDKAIESPEQLRHLREARTYVLEFDQDGSFHVDDVPPGTYQLQIHVTKPKSDKNRNWTFPNPDDDLGLLVREVIVPPGDAPFDLGKLTMKIKDAGGQKKQPVADFTGRTLDGQSISLAQYRGKYLVLTFWTSWSDRSTEQLENVRKLQEQLGQDNRIAFLNVSLDEDPKAVRQIVETRGYKWTQAALDSATVAKAAGNFDVSSLPAIYLLDPHGQIVGSNLEGDRLQTIVKRQLRN